MREGKKFQRRRRMLHCERRAAVMAPPDIAMYFYGRRELGEEVFFTIFYDLQFSSDTQMWREEIARLSASRCPGSSTSPRRSARTRPHLVAPALA